MAIPAEAGGVLTERQETVLHHLLRGRSEKEVAILMGITDNTVHYHVKAVYRILNVHSRAELMSLWIAETLRK